MPYRDMPGPEPTGKRVKVRAYLDLVAAELARVELEGKGIVSTVVQAASFNPLLVAATGGHLLLVDEADFVRADELLRRGERDIDDGPDGEPEGTMRCPRCEGVYCRHGRLPIRLFAGHPIALPFALPFWLFAPARFYCEKCDHVWKKEAEGPRRATRLAAGDPRPVFLLWRGHGGSGLFLGAIAGTIALVVFQATLVGVALFAVAMFAGWFFGRVIGKFVCSQPGCRAELAAKAEACPRCHGSVAGRVTTASEHYAAAADFRRDLAKALGRRKKRKALPAANA